MLRRKFRKESNGYKEMNSKKRKLLWCRSNRLWKLWGASMSEHMVAEMTKKMKQSVHSSLSEPMNQGFSPPMKQWISNATNQLISASTAQGANEAVNQLTTDWRISREPMNQRISESENQESNGSMDQWFKDSMSLAEPSVIHQWFSKSANRSNNESLNRWTDESMNHWTKESMNESMIQWFNEPVNQWISESINQWNLPTWSSKSAPIPEFCAILKCEANELKCKPSSRYGLVHILLTWSSKHVPCASAFSKSWSANRALATVW